MKGEATIYAATLDEARANASAAFREFFGEREFLIVDETAFSHCALMNGQVLSWRCEFTAELSAD